MHSISWTKTLWMSLLPNNVGNVFMAELDFLNFWLSCGSEQCAITTAMHPKLSKG